MNRTRTELLIDDTAMWSGLIIYLFIWSVLLSAGFRSQLLFPAFGVSCLYVAMHVYEITVRGHCLLSADSTALPVTFLATVSGALVAHLAGDLPWKDIGEFVARGGAAFMAAHVVVLAYSAGLTSLARWCLQHRIVSEKNAADKGT